MPPSKKLFNYKNNKNIQCKFVAKKLFECVQHNPKMCNHYAIALKLCLQLPKKYYHSGP